MNALIFAGAVSSSQGKLETSVIVPGAGVYSDIDFCAVTVKKHILNVNSYADWDVFMHSWNPDLEVRFRRHYAFRASVFELNAPYEASLGSKVTDDVHFGVLSHSLSMAKAAALVLRSERASGKRYDRFLLMRPDLLTFRDLDLTHLDRSGAAFCNSHGNAGGDFHFVLERWHLETLAANVEGLLEGSHPSETYLTSGHSKMKEFLFRALAPPECIAPERARDDDCRRGSVVNDNQIHAGADQEIYRKAPFHIFLVCASPLVRGLALQHYVDAYGLSRESVRALEAKSEGMPCPGSFRKNEPFSAMDLCCVNIKSPATASGVFNLTVSFGVGGVCHARTREDDRHRACGRVYA